MVSYKGVIEFIQILKKIDGKNVKINIKHKLYGDQNLQVALRILDNEERLGFLVNGQEVYIQKNEISDVGAKDGLWYFADKIMCITIREM